jgi:hypothetical protein
LKVNQEQIEDLYAFTRKHFVEWFDLQTELVDHLANDIEAVWQETPSLSYKEARDRAFKKFGVFGFMDVIEKRLKAMSKKYTKCLFAELKKWFEIPQMFATTLMFFVFLISFSSSISEHLLIVFYVLLIIWSGYKGIQLNREFRRRKELSDKKWLLEEMIFRQAGGTGFLLVAQIGNIYRMSDWLFNETYVILISAFVATLLCLINYISFEVIPNKAEKLLKDTYPEFVL